MMEEQVRKKLEELRAEMEAGQRQLRGLEARSEELRATLMRISGAIQVLEELEGEARGPVSQTGEAAGAPRGASA